MKQLKSFLYVFLSLIAVGVFSLGISSQTNSSDRSDCENCCQTQIMVLEKSQTKDIHLVYDFTRGTVSTVVVNRSYSTPDTRVYTAKLSQ